MEKMKLFRVMVSMLMLSVVDLAACLFAASLLVMICSNLVMVCVSSFVCSWSFVSNLISNSLIFCCYSGIPAEAVVSVWLGCCVVVAAVVFDSGTTELVCLFSRMFKLSG